MTTDTGRRSHAWKKLRRQRLTIAATNHEPCWRCGQPIDYQATYRTPDGRVNRGYPVAGHTTDVIHTGLEIVPLDQLAPEHFACSARSGRALQVVPGKTTTTTTTKNTTTKTATNKSVLSDPLAAGPAPEPRLFQISTIPGPISTIPGRRVPETLSKNPRMPGERDGLPRFFSAPHPEAVGSRGDEMVAFAERRRGTPLRWFQWLCAQRRYEVRADGSWCWLLSLESLSRQQGKSVDIAEDAAWTCSVAQRTAGGELFEVLHAAHRVKTSLGVQAELWAWADSTGLDVRRLLGDSKVLWPDAVWATVAMESVYGRRPSRLLADEAWAMDPVKFWNSMFPGLGDKANVQALFFSAANESEKGLIADLRGDESVCRMEWGVVAGEDHRDERVWRASSAFWGPGRLELMRAAVGRPGFAANWLNEWPQPVLSTSWLPGWEQRRTAAAPVAVCAVEAAYGFPPVLAAAGRDGARVVVSVVACESMADAAARVAALGVPVHVGKSLLRDPAWTSIVAEPASATTAACVDEFRRLFDEGVLWHDGSPTLSDQVAAVRVAFTPEGARVSSRSARVDAIKAAVWAAHAARARESWFVY